MRIKMVDKILDKYIGKIEDTGEVDSEELGKIQKKIKIRNKIYNTLRFIFIGIPLLYVFAIIIMAYLFLVICICYYGIRFFIWVDNILPPISDLI